MKDLHKRNRFTEKNNINFIGSITTDYNRKIHNKCSKVAFFGFNTFPQWLSEVADDGRTLARCNLVLGSHQRISYSTVVYLVAEIFCSMTDHTEYPSS